mgnify:CR=1 FL=1
MKKLPYLDCVILEIYRTFSSVSGMFERRVQEDMILGGVNIKKGTCIDNFWLKTFFDPKTFKDPQEFKPERW